MPDWDWLWHADIESFPNAVMAAHHPNSKNLGDVTADDFMQMASAFGAIDVLAGGPPCQDFSVAGLRAGLTGDRGNLTARFLEITHAIRPRNLLVENVPGWLSMPDNAFGSFLGGLVGADDALLPCEKPAAGKSNAGWSWRKAGMVWQLIEHEDGIPVIIDNPEDYEPSEIKRVSVDARHVPKWPSVGMVAGPRARAAWRVLDAQYFGLAQRRKRVFIVADFGNGADPAKVLLEPKSLRGNPPTREKEGKDVAGTIAARTRGGGGLGTDFDLSGGLVADRERVAARMVAFGEYEDDGTASTMKQRDYKDATDLVAEVVGTLCKDSFSGGAGGRPEGAVSGHFIPERAVSFKPSHYTRGKDGAPSDISPPLTADADKGDQDSLLLVPEIARTLLGKHQSSPAGDMGTYVADGPSAYRTTGNDGCYEMGDKINALTTSTDPTSYVVADHEPAAYDLRGRDHGAAFEGPHDTANIRSASGGSSRSYINQSWTVRRLTPTECARLQGFADDYCQIQYRGKPAVDGPIYKALGNSWAVPCGRWILERIERYMP